MTVRTPAPPLATGPPTVRLAWLDALRGLGATAVAFHHATYHYLPGLRRQMLEWFDAGTYGVLVFFLVSGYIIPASLERTGSLRRFWIGRLFRIYPLLCAVLAVVVLQALLGLSPLRGGLDRVEPVTAVLAHATMLQDLTAVPNAVNVLWTLSYEMAFYLLVAAAFVLGVHRRSAPIALGLAGLAVAFGGVLPLTALSRHLGVTPVVVLTALVVAAVIGTALWERRGPAAAAAVAGGILAAALVAGNGRIGAWQGLVILAVMFTGTVIHRAEHGRLSRRRAAGTAAAVMAAAVVAGVWHLHAWGGMTPARELAAQRAWGGAVILAALTFGAGLALRHRRMPRALTWLGVISYSIYLLHSLLLTVLDMVIGRPGADRPLLLALFFALLLPMCWATHRWIELPAQRLGRRITAREPAPAP